MELDNWTISKREYTSVKVYGTEYRLDIYSQEDGLGGFTQDDTWIADLQGHPELRAETGPLANEQEAIRKLKKIMRDRIRRALLKGIL